MIEIIFKIQKVTTAAVTVTTTRAIAATIVMRILCCYSTNL